jgi:hypothetical protein
MIYISVDYEGQYNHSGRIREAGITAMQINEKTLNEIQKNPTELPSNTKSYCPRATTKLGYYALYCGAGI